MSTSANPTSQSPLNISSKDKFYLSMDLPTILRKYAATDPNLSINPILMTVHGTVVPDISVPEVDMRFQGQNLHLSTYARPSYPGITINYTIDSQYNNYYVFWRWLDVMNLAIEDYYGGTSSQNQALAQEDQFEYQTTITITALNEYNEPILDFIYSKAFLSSLGGITYSYREGQTLMEGSATFHFSQLDVVKKNNGYLDK
jgi:hypothetical protein